MVYVLAYHLHFSVFWQANKVWSSEEECPRHSFFIGKKSPAAKACCTNHRPNPEQGTS